MIEQKVTTFKNGVVSFTDTGKGTAVVLLHGFLENKTMWNALVPVLAEKYRVITIDLLGHGHTDPHGYLHTMEDNADMVHTVLSELRLRKVILVGHSMGGYVALAFAELYPEMVKAIALLNSTAKADSEERKKNRDRAIKAVKQNYANFVRMSVVNLFSESNRERLKEEIEHVREQALRTPLQGVIASLEGMKIREDREKIMHAAEFPFLLVLGEKDEVLNIGDTSKLADHASTKLVTFPDGHMSTVENRDELAQVLLDFLKSV
jgi:pimeloyl-ACP methyl ester carboxylesterase